MVSNSIPVGTAVLGDWTKLRLYVREDATLALDASGPLFTTNQFVARDRGSLRDWRATPVRVRHHRPHVDHDRKSSRK